MLFACETAYLLVLASPMCSVCSVATNSCDAGLPDRQDTFRTRLSQACFSERWKILCPVIQPSLTTRSDAALFDVAS